MEHWRTLILEPGCEVLEGGPHDRARREGEARGSCMVVFLSTTAAHNSILPMVLISAPAVGSSVCAWRPI